LADISEINRSGKKVIILREDNKIIERETNISIEEARDRYKEHGSIKKNIHKHNLTNFIEVTEYTDGDKNDINLISSYKTTPLKNKSKYGKYQYYVSGQFKRGHGTSREIHATSFRHDSSYPIEKARNEAYSIFWNRVNAQITGVSNPEATEKAISSIEHIREGIKYYVAKSRE
jgi:hypothetical protein